MDTSYFEKALSFAMKAHSGQVRKGTNVPYILHPIEVATIVSTLSEDQNVIAAALLHDTVEDSHITLDEIQEHFGFRVRELVASETEDKKRDRPSHSTWMERKEESLKLLKETNDEDVKRLWLSDKLANMRSFYRMYREEGDALWDHFNEKDPRKQKWYYTEIKNVLSDLENTAALREYNELVSFIFQNID